MNPIAAMLFKWYLFITLLAAFASITIPFVEILPGLIVTWIIGIAIFVGINFKSGTIRTSIPAKPYLIPLPIAAMVAVASSLFATKFYTGQQIQSVIVALSSGTSLYNEYQKYFAQEDIAQFSLNKVPAILSLYLLKVSVLYGFIRVTIIEAKIKFLHIILLVIIILAQMFFSLARGTSFELFEIILLMWFCLSLRAHLQQKKVWLITKSKVIFAISAMAALSLYSYNISARYSFGEIQSCATGELCFSSDTLLYNISPGLAQLSYKLSGYFTFGIFYTSHVIQNYWLTDFSNFISLLTPVGLEQTKLVPGFLCDITLDCGAAWSPDFVSYLINFGFLATLLFFCFFGYFCKILLWKISQGKSIVQIGALFYLFLSMVSLPVGNFITASSANILMVVTIVFMLCWRKLFTSSGLSTNRF